MSSTDRWLEIDSIDPAHLRALVSMDGVGVWEWNPTSDSMRLNEALDRVADFGGSAPGTLADMLALIHADDYVTVRSVLDEVRAGIVPQLMLTLRVRQPDRSWKWVCFHGRTVEVDPSGRPALLVGIAFEPDERRIAARGSSWPQDVEGFLDDIDIAAWWYDARSDITIRSRRWSMMLGYMPHEIRSGRQAWLDLMHPDDVSRVVESLRGLDRVGHDSYQHEYRLRCRDGGYLWVLARVRVHSRGPDGQGEVFSGLFLDISMQIEARQALEALSSTDALTGIANRRTFDDSLSSMWCEARRSGRPLCLLLIDVDHFKLFNDRYGHQAGDDCLRALAESMSGVLPGEHDCLARYGGEEFAALLPDCRAVDALHVADRICRVVRKMSVPATANGTGRPAVSVSVGIASSEDMALDSPEHLVGAADGALYAAKHRGRDRVIAASGPMPA